MHLEAGMQARGYLFLATAANEARMEARLSRMLAAGARVERIGPDEVARRAPGVRVDDVRFALFGPEDGYADPRAVLTHLRRRAEDAGVAMAVGEAVEIEHAEGRVTGVRLEGGGRLATARVVNAAGAFAAELAARAGLALPVVPVRQHIFRARLPEPAGEPYPMLIDPTGVHFRSESPDVIRVAFASHDEPPGENLACDESRWPNAFLPALSARMPGFARLALVDGWAGHYEVTPDRQPIVGEHPDLAGFYLANGFSGHGLMMAPAIGLAVAELVTRGRFVTFDLSRYALARFARGELLAEDPVISSHFPHARPTSGSLRFG